MTTTDTISAVATAPGQAALGIVRISGPGAGPVLNKLVPAADPVANPGRMTFGRLRDVETGELIDEVLCFFSPGPGTATGEDVAEIHGHGGALVLHSILTQTRKAGCRPAHPGEFTARAYRNGRMDLTQAEAVMALIGARSELAARTAARQLKGAIGEGLQHHYDDLTALCAQLEAGLDFPDEDLPLDATGRLAERLALLGGTLQGVANTFELGQRLTQGAKIAIVGPSNAGKSSLLNRLLGEDRALVDAEPGTTRDVVEAGFEVDGIPVAFLDTAGLRAGAERVERAGMERSRHTATQADLVLLVVDGAAKEVDGQVDEEVHTLANTLAEKTLLVANKCDLDGFSLPGFGTPIPVSAQTGLHIQTLLSRIGQYLRGAATGDVVLTTARQKASVDDAVTHIQTAANLLAGGQEPELAAAELRWARDAFASLWGRHAQTDVVDKIFSTFCLGK